LILFYNKIFFQLVFSFGLPLCKLLQKEKIGLREAVSLAEDIMIVLKNNRLNCDIEFHKHCPHKFAIQIYFDPPPPPMKHSQLRRWCTLSNDNKKYRNERWNELFGIVRFVDLQRKE
jgi:hypothetical protein